MTDQLGLLDAESEDPNADLIGYEFGDGIVVVRTAPWSDTYMEVEGPGLRSVRATSLLRAAKLRGG